MREFLSVSLICVFLVACGGGGSPADLRLAHDAEPQTLDPALMTGVAEGRIAGALFEGLTRLDPATLEALPGVAESWEVSADGLVWTFRLRPDASWSDGRPVTAEDFRWSWLRVISPVTASSYAGLLFDVHGAREYQSGEADEPAVGLRAIDDRTLEVRLLRPVPYFPSLAAFFTLLPVPRAVIEAHGDRWTREGVIVSNGPFVLERWSFYREIVLSKNPAYWDRERVKVGRIRVFPVVDPNTQFNLYETGDVDVLFSVPSTILPRLLERRDFVHGPRLATAFVRLNVTRPPFDSPDVRRAFGLAMDREAIVRRITRGGEVPTGALVPPGLPGYEPPAGQRFHPEQAATLLARAGYPAGEGFPEVTLLISDNVDHAAIATVLQHQWKRHLGVEVHLDSREWKVYLASMKRIEYGLAFGQWIGDYPDPSTFLDCFKSGSGNNRTGWADPRYDDLLRRAAEKLPGESPDAHARRRLRQFREAEELLVEEELPILPVYHPTLRFLVAPRVTGFTPNLLGFVQFSELALEPER